MLPIIDTDQDASASETEDGLSTIQESEEYGKTVCTKYSTCLYSYFKQNTVTVYQVMLGPRVHNNRSFISPWDL